MEVPNHLAVIIDGNRRWAKQRGMPAWVGHRQGAKNLDKFFDWCFDLGVPQVSAWVMSTENYNERSKEEIKNLMKIFEDYLEDLLNKRSSVLDKYEIRLRFVGDLNKLPPRLVKLMGKLMIKTAKYQKKLLNIMINYGGQYELIEVMKKIAKKVIKAGRIELTRKDIEANLLVPTPLDLIIRTGGHNRLSGFMPWQSAYAEIYTTNTLWPAFNKKELIKAIEWYDSIKRNFGK